MYNEVANDLNKSTTLFDRVLKPRLKEVMGGHFKVVEGITINEHAKKLDRFAGIDLWHIDEEKGIIRGVASRIQFSDTNWGTFTVRKERDSGTKTEYEKRKYAIEEGALYPSHTLQAYISDDEEIVSFAIAKTEDIIEMIDIEHCDVKHTGNDQKGQASFYVVKWQDMRDNNYPIYIES